MGLPLFIMTDRTRHILQHLVTFLIGAGAAMCLCLTCNPIKINNSKDVLVQSDTIVRFETLHYSGLELSRQTIKLDVPKISTREMVFIEEASLDTIYRDSVRYVTLPREYYYTKVRDAEIWHSGVDSRIDSLNVFRRDMYVTDTYKRKDWKHEVSIFASAGYDKQVRVPIGVEYTYYPKRWIGVGGKVEHDLISGCTGVYAKTNIRIGW